MRYKYITKVVFFAVNDLSVGLDEFFIPECVHIMLRDTGMINWGLNLVEAFRRKFQSKYRKVGACFMRFTMNSFVSNFDIEVLYSSCANYIRQNSEKN